MAKLRTRASRLAGDSSEPSTDVWPEGSAQARSHISIPELGAKTGLRPSSWFST